MKRDRMFSNVIPLRLLSRFPTKFKNTVSGRADARGNYVLKANVNEIVEH